MDTSPTAAPIRASLPLLATVLGVTLLVFWRALFGDFVYDDLHLAAGNPALGGLGELLGSLGRPYWGFVEGEAAAGVGFWRPLSTVALYVGRLVGGGSPTGFHAVSLVLHLAATAVAFRLIGGLTQSSAAAAAGALVFAIHPVQVEAVAWISAVNDPLAGLCVLAALDAVRRWRGAGSPRAALGAPAGAMVWFALGLLAKESALALVPLLLAMELTVTAPTRRAALRPLLGAVAVLVGWWALRAAVFASPMAGFDQVSSHLFVDAGRQLTLRLELLGGALGLLAWPAELNLFREVRPQLPAGDPTLAWAGVAIGTLGALLAAALFTGRRRLALALLIVPAALAPALISFDSIGRFPLSERFLYLACLAPALLPGVIVAELTARDVPRPPRVALGLGFVAVAAILGLRSNARLDFWSNELTLFRSGVAASPKSAYVRWGLGRALLESYERTGDVVTLEEAHQAFLAAQDITSPLEPDAAAETDSVLVTHYDQIQASLGVAWYYLLCARDMPQECTFEEAELVFAELSRRTAGTPYRRSYARAQLGLGLSRSYLGRTDEALLSLKEATNLAPELAEAWYARGELERRMGDARAAEASYDAVLRLVPRDVEARVGRAAVLTEQGRPAEATAALQQALRLDPGCADAHVQLGLLAGAEGRTEAALTRFDQALEHDPEHGLAHLNRSKALLQEGRFEEAVAGFQATTRYLPGSFEAHYNLGVLLMSANLSDQGSAHLEAALAIEPDHELAPRIRASLAELGAR